MSPGCTQSLVKQLFSFHAPRAWNELQNIISSEALLSLSTFKGLLQTALKHVAALHNHRPVAKCDMDIAGMACMFYCVPFVVFLMYCMFSDP